MTPGRLGLLLTSPRLAPGLLSHAAWEAVAGSGLRLARSLQDPLAEAVEESGFAVEEVGDASPAPHQQSDRGFHERCTMVPAVASTSSVVSQVGGRPPPPLVESSAANA